MSDAHARATGGCALFLLCLTAPPGLCAAAVVQQTNGAAFEVENSPAAEAAFTACAEIVQLLADHGWDTGGVSVRIQGNLFDATSPAADVVVAANQPGQDAAFALAAALVERQLRHAADASVARILAQEVAAHLSPPGSARRTRWELAWRSRLGDGDVLSTALPELLWRTGGDAAIRTSARHDWPASAFDALAALGLENTGRALSEVAVAGLLDPSVLGFRARAALDFSPVVMHAGPDVRFDGPAMRIVALTDDAGAVAVLPLENEGVEAWVAVRYALTGAYDLVPLSPRAEVTVPLRGVAWAAVVAVADAQGGRLSLAVRSVPDYPARLMRWDFLASGRSISLNWETLPTEGLRAFVVEALRRNASSSWSVLRRTVVPVGDAAEISCGYGFVDDDGEGVTAYRLLALTADGFLAEMGSFPVRDTP